MKGLNGQEKNFLVKEKNLQQELIRRALFTECDKATHES